MRSSLRAVLGAPVAISHPACGQKVSFGFFWLFWLSLLQFSLNFLTGLLLRRVPCAFCGFALYPLAPDHPRDIICFDCLKKSTPMSPSAWFKQQVQKAESMTVLNQLTFLLLGIPSRLPVPSWPEVFAREEMKGAHPGDEDFLFIHMCAKNLNTEALKLTLERWPDSVNEPSKVWSLVVCL